jgi:hypothetical protein
LITHSLLAVENGQVLYLGGTIPALSENTLGKLDLTRRAMQFDSPKGKFEIPYKTIDAFQSSEELTHHLGVLLPLPSDLPEPASIVTTSASSITTKAMFRKLLSSKCRNKCRQCCRLS